MYKRRNSDARGKMDTTPHSVFLRIKKFYFSMSDGALLVPPEGTNGHISGVKRDPN